MIKINELRIGNKLQTVGIKQVITIKSIVSDKDDCYLSFEEGNGCYTTSLKKNRVEPIPLTPEIFKKCGALELASWMNYAKLMISVNKNTGLFLTADNYIGNVTVTVDYEGEGETCRTIVGYENIKYLHQLQNLYLDLTNGDELEFKEPVNQ